MEHIWHYIGLIKKTLLLLIPVHILEDVESNMYNQTKKSFEFNGKKALEAILYIADRVKDKYRAVKILYLAEKYCLENYGIMICGNKYARLPYGTAPSDTLDMLKLYQNEDNKDLTVRDKELIPKRKFDFNYLSKIDLECLDKLIEENKDLSFDELKKKTHENDPSYQAADPSVEHFISIEHFVLGTKNPSEILKNLETIYH